MMFREELELKFHQDIYHNNDSGNYICSLCGKRFQLQRSLKYHKNHVEHDENQEGKVKKGPRPCPFCKKKFGKHIHKQLHVFQEHKDRILYCSICSKPHTAEDCLMPHMKKFHPGVKLLRCKHCEKEFAHKLTLSYHIDKDHEDKDIDGRVFTCSIDTCQKRFQTQMNLDQHARVHESQKQREQTLLKGVKKTEKGPCSVCGKIFVLRNIKDHYERYHTDQAKFKCSDCDKTFTTRLNLTNHSLAVHLKRELKCPIESCQKIFYSRAVLSQHLKGVHAETKHKCPQCEKEFSHRGNLREHIKGVHKGIKSFC
jgi:DNA-directed RNA polymerase subunit RPC12/RpoP